MGILTLIYLVSIGFLLWVTRHRRRWYARAKGACSLLFVVCGIWGTIAGDRDNVPSLVLLVLALVLCAGGDVLLGLANKTPKVRAKPFLAGTVLFMLAHVLFCAMLYVRGGFSLLDFLLPAAGLLAVFGLERAGLIRLNKMRPAGYIYTFLVCLMAAKAVMLALQMGLVPGLALAGGGILFLLSDIVLLFLYFGTARHRLLRYANLTTYYLGVYLLAVSACWL